jgi:hypothetical protein
MQNYEEKWTDLCARAAVEQNPQELTRLVAEIIQLIDQRKAKRTERNLIGQQEPVEIMDQHENAGI